jgi:hypothetical protein
VIISDSSFDEMEGKLTEKYMDQLEQWIDTVPKTFTLLFAITRDGCDPVTFHQKCDNQGATVTVLYNQHGSVYGGFTSISWTSKTGVFVKDDKAFLYQLKCSGRDNFNIFRVNSPDGAIVHNNQFGPLFGSGYELFTFKGRINRSENIFPLNGSMNQSGNTYNNQGMTANQINNGTMEVTELEVYMVTGNILNKYYSLSTSS